jgi:hypothetical protein
MRAVLRLLLVLFPVVASAASIDSVMSRDRQDREAYRAARSSSRIATQSITKVGSDYWLLIPAAGNLQGNFGTYYKSDVMITNHRSTPQLVDVSFFQQGQNGVSGFALIRLTIPATTGVFFDDFVGKVLGKTGFGTLDFRARTSNGDLDIFSAKIDVFSRIWTPMANAAGTIFAGGTTSQSFPGIDVASLDGTANAYLLGLQQDSQFRTNVGIYNYDTSNAHTFTVNVHGSFGDTSTTVTVPAWSIVQTSIPAGNWGPLFLVVIPDSGMASWWAAYASSSDNRTGDGWISIGSQND